MILVDTTVWVDHLRGDESELRELLDAGRVLMHSMVVGELACGTLPNRAEFIRRLNSLPAIDESVHSEVLSMIDSRKLMGRGIGYVDAHLVRSVLNRDGAVLWTRDRRLRQVAEDLGIAYSASVQEKG